MNRAFIIAALFIPLSALGMNKSLQLKIAQAVCEHLEPGFHKQQPYLRRFCNQPSLVEELQKSPLYVLDKHKAQLDHQDKRFYVTLHDDPRVVAVYKLAQKGISER